MIDTAAVSEAPVREPSEAVLEQIERRVLWLATTMVHHANKVRQSASAIKVGGHQASSASMVSMMTALYFKHLRPEDHVSVKPHAAPVLHAINYLLGRLDERYLTELRAFGGLQSYPSRSKDPDPVDFSTGSVGIGATATIWSALAQRYVHDHVDPATAGRRIALVGDAELDEGVVWEALLDPMVSRLGEVLWIVDVNRQSLDRIIPDIAASRVVAMFEAAGWQTITIKYGRLLRAQFDRPGGDALRARLDAMSNEEYQRMLRSPATDVRARLADDPRTGIAIRRLLHDVEDRDVVSAVRDLGGHDLVDLSDAIDTAKATTERPTVIFAYTIKARGLPTEGHPANHSALLNADQWRQFASTLGTDPDRPWETFPEGSPEASLCTDVARRLLRQSHAAIKAPDVPVEIGQNQPATGSTQQAFGRFLTDLARSHPAVAERVVTASPDVASSTNLGGWINRVGVWNPAERNDWFADDTDMLMKWREGHGGQHIELGIAEANLVGLLGELGLTWSRLGQPLLPIGTLYDPFVTRALEQWSFGIYAGGQSILVGTPSGVTLAPEGGAHQSIITPSIGLEQPQCVSWEPCFSSDLEWTLLHALGRLGHTGGSSAYFRLSTRPIEQRLAELPADRSVREQRRQHAVAGGYVLRRATNAPAVTLAGMGVVMPEVCAAADKLGRLGIDTDVICLTSADLVFRALQARQGLAEDSTEILDVLLPSERNAPIVTVLDGHPHTLSFLAAINGTRTANLGVDNFGQVGDIDDLYRHFGIDVDTIVGAAWDLLDESRVRPEPTSRFGPAA